MVEEILVEQREAGLRLVKSLREAGIKIKAAFWSFSTEDQGWKLVIATPSYDEFGPLITYDRIQKVLEKNPEIENLIRLHDIRATSNKNRVIKELHHKLGSLKSPLEASVSLTGFSGDLIEDVYVYQL